MQGGSCRQVTSPLVGCQERERLGYGPCGDALVNCLHFNLITKNCEDCVEGWFFDFTGKCTLRTAKCGPDEVSIQGLCVQRPANCAQVDNLGLCSKCIGDQYQLQHGQCVFMQKCPPGQFLVNSQCVLVTANCQHFNPTSGQCLTCNDGRPATQGLCCLPHEFVMNGACTTDKFSFLQQQLLPISRPECLLFHPTLKHCLQCN